MIESILFLFRRTEALVTHLGGSWMDHANIPEESRRRTCSSSGI